jgi:DHA2 family multidrug resistance protein
MQATEATAPAASAIGEARERPYSPVETGWRLAAVAVGCLISVFLDQGTSGAVGAAIPYMQGTLGASADEGPWLTITYNTIYYLSLISSAWMIGRFGRRQVWVVGHATYAVACFLIAVTPDFHTVAILRALQGAGQGTFFVCAVMTILRAFPPSIAFVGFAIFASTSLSGPAAGPWIGGWFVDQNAWQWLFVLLGGLATIAALIVARVLRDPPQTGPRAELDALGLVLAFFHYFTFHYLAQFGERRDWLGGTDVRWFFAAFVFFTSGFIWWELWGTDHPFIKMRLFEIHNLRWGALLGFILGIPLFGSSIFLQYLQTGIGFTPTLSGELLATRIGAVLVFAPMVAYALNKRLLDPRFMIVTGFLLVFISYWMQYVGTTYTADFGTFVFSVVISGAGFALLFSPIASTVLTSIPPDDFTRGVAIFKLTLTTGGAVASAALGVILDHRNAYHLSMIAGSIDRATPAIQTFLQNGSQHALAAAASSQSQILAYADAAQYTAIVVLLAAPLAVILRPPPRQPPAARVSEDR